MTLTRIVYSSPSSRELPGLGTGQDRAERLGHLPDRHAEVVGLVAVDIEPVLRHAEIAGELHVGDALDRFHRPADLRRKRGGHVEVVAADFDRHAFAAARPHHAGEKPLPGADAEHRSGPPLEPLVELLRDLLVRTFAPGARLQADVVIRLMAAGGAPA